MKTLELFPYQKFGAGFLASRKVALLADEQGIGKTAQAIRACDLVKAERILVVCRAVARANWAEEFQKFSSQKRLVSIAYDRVTPLNSKTGIWICSYELLEKVLRENHALFDVLIFDESHYLKEPTARRTQTALGKGGAIRHAKRTWLLSGTPSPNHAGEWWTVLYTFGVTKLTYDQFTERHCNIQETGFGRKIVGTNTDQSRIEELQNMIKKICLRRTKEDVNLELPPIFYQDITVEAGPVKLQECRTFLKWVWPEDKSKEFEKILEKELGVLNGIVKNGELSPDALSALEANAKSFTTLRRYCGMQKVQPVVDLITEELNNNAYSKVVLFAIHRDCILALKDKLTKNFGAVSIFGGSDPERVEDRVKRFQNLRNCRVMIAQIHSAGTSLTFTAANQVVFVESDLVPGNNQQAAMRCHRIGQTKPVTVRYISLANSVDQHINRLLSRKTREISELLNGIESHSANSAGPDSKTKSKIDELL